MNTLTDTLNELEVSRTVTRVAIQRNLELETALNRMVLAHENTLSDSDGHYPEPDMGCTHCTGGTVPQSRDTGPCAYHAAKLLLGQT